MAVEASKVVARLHLATNLALPLDAITETFGVLAVRGAGKSTTAAVMAEEMHKAHLPFVVVDPVGTWWGLRSSRDGKGPGLPIPIFGGKHGDVPLERTGGQLVADLIVDERLACVIDLAGFDSEAAKKAFLLDFARRLYQRNEEPLHLFLEEADDYIPQRPMRDEAQLLRAWENIVRRGRARGLGMTLITQRSAALNKAVLTQVQTLIAMRTTGPQDRAAIEDWLRYHAQSREILESLAGLRDGEAWVWSPEFLRQTVRVRIRPRETFDSGATPRLAAARRAPATLADIDLDAVERRMAATIERAKASDPAALRARTAQLERELAAARTAVRIERVEVPLLTDANERALAILATALAECQATLAAINERLRAEAAVRAHPILPIMAAPAPAAPRNPVPRTPTRECRVSPSEARVLTALAQYPEGRTKRQLALLTRYASGGGRFNNLLGAFRTAGYIEGSETLRITDLGRRTLGVWTPLPTGRALFDYWKGKLGSGEGRVLDVLRAGYPRPVEKDRLAADSGYEVGGGRFNNILGQLRTLELIEGRGELRLSPILADDAERTRP